MAYLAASSRVLDGFVRIDDYASLSNSSEVRQSGIMPSPKAVKGLIDL
jgi:hypothetical protein